LAIGYSASVSVKEKAPGALAWKGAAPGAMNGD
jgi:hypothetical protein